MPDRLVKLENRTADSNEVDSVGIIGVTLLFTLGQTAPKKVVEASEVILRDDSGRIRAKLSIGVHAGASPSYPASP